jgi:hypothetical protein
MSIPMFVRLLLCSSILVAAACASPAEPTRYELPGWEQHCDLGMTPDGTCRASTLDLARLANDDVAMFRGDGRLEIVRLQDDAVTIMFEALGGAQADQIAHLHVCDLDGDAAEDIVVSSRNTAPYAFFAGADADAPYTGRRWPVALSEVACIDFDGDARDDLGGVHVEQDDQGPFVVVRGDADGLVETETPYALTTFKYTLMAARRTQGCGVATIASGGLLATEVVVSSFRPGEGPSAPTTIPLPGTAKRLRFLERPDKLVLFALVRRSETETTLEIFERPGCDDNDFTPVGEVDVDRVLDWEVDHETGQLLLVDAGAGVIRVYEWADPDGLVLIDGFSALATTAMFYDDVQSRHGVLWASVTDPFLTFSAL